MLSPDIAHFLTQYSDQTIMDKYLSLLANDLGASKSPSIKAIHQEYQQKIKTYQNKMNQLESDALSKTRSLEQSHRVQLQRYESEINQLKQQHNTEINRYKSEIQQLKVSLENAKRTTSQSNIQNATSYQPYQSQQSISNNYQSSNDELNNLVQWLKGLKSCICFKPSSLYQNEFNSKNIVNIERLSLSENKLTEIPSLKLLKNLKKLYINNNKLEDLPVWLKEMSLDYINFQSNPVNLFSVDTQNVINTLKRNNPRIKITY